DDAVAVNPEPARVHHLAGVGGDHRHAARRGQIESEVHLLIDFLPLVEIGPVIREGGLDLRVAQLDEGAAPQLRQLNADAIAKIAAKTNWRSWPFSLRN